jgi:alpha-tubulin suppressor-like RCC1 family protein
VSAGGGASCGLTTDDVSYCWGDNHLGQLGDGTLTNRNRPVRAAGGLALRSLSAGGAFTGHTCGVTSRNVAYCWGVNSLGELGIGNHSGPRRCLDINDQIFSCSTRPVRIAGGRTFTRVDAGYGHTCALTGAGAVYCWGGNYAGQLGIGNSTGPEDCQPNPFGLGPCSTRPLRVVGGLTFRDVQAGGAHTCGLTAAGARAYCWGQNDVGQLGIGTSTGPATCHTETRDVPCSTRPQPVGAPRS